MLPRENRRRMLTASSPYSTPAYTRGGGSLVPSSLGTRFMGAGALTASSSSTTGGTPPSLHFISARLEDDLKTMWQFRLTGDSWADQLPSTKALQTVRQCINAISPGSTRNVWDTLVIGRTTVANVMVAAEMVVQIAEAVGMGTHYWTPERLDASRLMASTEGMVDLNIARLGQVQAEAWGTTAMAGDLSRDFVKRHGQPVYDLVGCWPSWDVLDQGHPRWTEVQKFAQFHSQVWARVSPTVHAMGNFIFRPKSGVGAKVLSIDDVFTPIFDAMDGFWDKAVSGTKPTWATAGSSENLVTLERLLVVDAIVYMAKAFYHFAVAWDGQAERRKLAVSSWNRKMEKNDEERRRTIERHQKDVDRLLGDQKAFALDNQKVAIPRHISELRMWLTEVRRVCRSANIYTPEDVAIVADRFFRCQSSVDNEWLMQSEVWAAFWGKLQSTRFDAMCVDSIGLMLAEKMGYHVFASKSQEVSQLQAEVKWMVNKKPVLHYMFQRIMDMVIMLTPAEAFKLTAVALFDLNNQVFIKMAKEIQTDTEVWEYLLKGTGQSTPEASPEIWNVDEDVLGKVMRRVQKTIIDEWKWSGPRSGTPTQGNQNQGGGDGAGPFEPGDEVYWGQGYSRRGPQFYGQRPQGGPGQGRQRFQRSYYNPRVHRPLCMKKAGALWLKSGAMCKSNCQNFHPEGWDDSVQKEVLRKVRYDYPVGPFHGLLNTNKYSQELKNLQDRDRKAYDQKGWTDPGEAPYLKGEWEKFRVWNPLTSDGGDAPASMGRDIPGRHGNESVDPSWNLRGSSDASSARSAASSSSSSSSSSSDRSDRGHLDNRRSRSRSRDRRSDREVTHVSGGRHYDERDEARDRRGYDRGGHVRGGYDRGRRDSRNRDRSPERSRDRSPPRRRGGRSDSRERPNSNRSPQWGGNQGSSLFPNANVYGGGAGTFPSSHMQQAGAGAYYAGPAPGQQLPVGYGQPMQQQFYQGQPQQQVVAYGGQSYIPPAPILPAPGMPMGGGQGTVGGQMPPQQQVQGMAFGITLVDMLVNVQGKALMQVRGQGSQEAIPAPDSEVGRENKSGELPVGHGGDMVTHDLRFDDRTRVVTRGVQEATDAVALEGQDGQNEQVEDLDSHRDTLCPVMNKGTDLNVELASEALDSKYFGGYEALSADGCGPGKAELPLLFTKIFIEDVQQECIVGNDTMASLNVLGKEFIELWSREPWFRHGFRPCRLRIKGVGGMTGVSGSVMLTFLLKDGKSFSHRFWVVPAFAGGLLLGLRNLRRMHARIYTDLNVVQYGGSEVAPRYEVVPYEPLRREGQCAVAHDLDVSVSPVMRADWGWTKVVSEGTEPSVTPHIQEPVTASFFHVCTVESGDSGEASVVADNSDDKIQETEYVMTTTFGWAYRDPRDVRVVNVDCRDSAKDEAVVAAIDARLEHLYAAKAELLRGTIAGMEDAGDQHVYIDVHSTTTSHVVWNVTQHKLPVKQPKPIVEAFLKSHWDDNLFFPKGVKAIKEVLKNRLSVDDFTIVIPVGTRTEMWWQDIEDHLIDDPVPIPHRGHKLVLALRLGTKEKALAYGAKLMQREMADVRKQAFSWISGIYHRTHAMQYAIIIDHVAQLAQWRGKEETRYHGTMVREDERPIPMEDVAQLSRKASHKEIEEARIAAEKAIAEKYSTWEGTMKERDALKGILENNMEVFGPLEAGSVRGYEANFGRKLGEDVVGHRRPSRMSYHEDRMAREITQELLEKDIIEARLSEVSSPVRMAPKPDGSLRMCINYYRINKILKQIETPVPDLRKGINRLKHAKVYTTLDLKSGFWQIPLNESCRYLTAFMVGMTTYVWKVLPMGLKCSPGLFQHAMTKMLGKEYDDEATVVRLGSTEDYAFCYIDDIIIYSESMEKHVEHVQDVLRRISAFGLRLNAQKCDFAQRKIQYLGYEISEGRCAIAYEKRNYVASMPMPKTRTDLHSFISLAQYYGEFIPGFAERVAVVRKFLKQGVGDDPWPEEVTRVIAELKDEIAKDPRQGGRVLMLPDWKEQFVLDTDASSYAVGAVLQQMDKSIGQLRPVMFISRQLIPAEKEYCTRQREALAIVWAFQRLREYLWGTPNILVRTDHHNLLWLMSGDHTGRLARWQLELAEYDFTIHYIKGKRNVVPDFCSRYEDKSGQKDKAVDDLQRRNTVKEVRMAQFEFRTPGAVFAIMGHDVDLHDWEEQGAEDTKLPSGLWYHPFTHNNNQRDTRSEEVSALEAVEVAARDKCACCYSPIAREACEDILWAEARTADRKEGEDVMEGRQGAFNAVLLPKGPMCLNLEDEEKVKEEHLFQLPEAHPEKVRFQLETDTAVRLASVETFRTFTKESTEYKELREHLLNPQARPEDIDIRKLKRCLVLKDGLLWYMGKDGVYTNEEDRWLLWVPQELRTSLLIAAHHCPMQSHPGVERMTWSLRRRFWWNNLGERVKEFVKGCPHCQMAKLPYRPKMGLKGEYDITLDIFDTLHIDHVGPFPEAGTEKFKYLLTVIDRTSNYVITVPVTDVTAEVTAAALIDQVFGRIGIPRRIISDRGTSFANEVSQRIAKFFGFDWQYVTAFNPMANGKIERVHRTLKAALKTYCKNSQLNWVYVVPMFTFAVNNLASASLGGHARGVSPHQVVYGRALNTPTELLFPPDKWEPCELLGVRLRAIAEARSAIEKCRETLREVQREQEMGKYSHVEYKEGDTVLLYVPTVPKGVSIKFYNKWHGPFKIVRQTGAYNYKIAPTGARGREQIVHVRRLAKFSPYLLEDENEEQALRRIAPAFRQPPALLTRKEREEALRKQQKEEKAEARNAGQQDRSASDVKVDVKDGREIPKSSEMSDRKGTVWKKPWIAGKEVAKIDWQVDKFYLCRPHEDTVMDKDFDYFFLMQVTYVQPRTRVRAALGLAPTMHFWRSKSVIDMTRERIFAPVFRDGKDLEQWDASIEKDDEDFTPWTVQMMPRVVLDMPFELTEERRIPLRIWDEVQSAGISFLLIGAPRCEKEVAAKKRRAKETQSEAVEHRGRGRPRKQVKT